MKKREALVERTTKETKIKLELSLDGEGRSAIKTGIPFLDHMLELFARHGLFDLTIAARGDLEVDYHHTVEDIGICLGEALQKALGSKKGINRYGQAAVPMDEALASAAIDISGRSSLIYNVKIRRIKIGDFNIGLVKDFLKAFSDHAALTLHINAPYGRDVHHVIEAIFKALGRALRQATELDPRVKGVPSTKGKL